MDAHLALPELSTITRVPYLLCICLGTESLGLVESVQHDDRLYVVWHLCQVNGNALVHVHILSSRAEVGFVSEETAELFVDFSENQLVNDLSFFVQEQQSSP